MASKKPAKTSGNKNLVLKKTTSSAAAGKKVSSGKISRKTGSAAKKTSQPKVSPFHLPIRLPISPRTSRPIREGLSPERKLDILGIFLALLGLLTLLSFFSPLNSSLTNSWSIGTGLFFGWGKYLFPIGLVIVGLWLVFRNFERIPLLAVERIVGFVLLYIFLCAVLHLVGMEYLDKDAFSLAQSGQGGGITGALVAGGLQKLLGIGGAIIALLAILLIALALSLDVTITEMVSLISQWVMGIREKLIALWILHQSPKAEMRTGSGAYPGVKHVNPLHAGESSAMELTANLTNVNQNFLVAADQSQITPLVWVLPTIEQILDRGVETSYNKDQDLQRARLIEETLLSFGAPAHVVEINRGPTITQFGVEPDFIESRGGRTRVRVGKISALADDLALALSARTIRVQAPVPGKGFVGIEVPNEEISLVALRDILESEAFKKLKSPLRFALGLNVSGKAVAADLSNMPHLLIAGATGSGKSVFVNALICCLLINNTPEDLRMVMVDPKRVELTGYNGVPHLLAPVVVELEQVLAVLQWISREMDMRYRKLAEAGCRNIQEYNSRKLASGEKKLPFLVVIVDELADLMMLAPEETERAITRLAQLARATGIHLVIATQRPSVDVVTGLIKANFSARIAFAVASGVDSRVILDQPGAERLLGRGDMLFQAPDAPAPVRLQGVFVSESEIMSLVSYWQSFSGMFQSSPTVTDGSIETLPASVPLKQYPLWDDIREAQDSDPLFNEAIDISRRQGRASISMLQRRMRIGYTRAARLVETMEEKGIVGPPDPTSGVREILDYGPAAPPADES